MELSRRREAREQRKRDQELEQVARLQREEEEKREAERKAREVLAAQRREERRLARQVGVRRGVVGLRVVQCCFSSTMSYCRFWGGW